MVVWLQEDDAVEDRADMLCVCICVTDNQKSGVEYRWHAFMVDVRRGLGENGFEGGIDAVSNLTQMTYLYVYELSRVVQSVIVAMWVVCK